MTYYLILDILYIEIRNNTKKETITMKKMSMKVLMKNAWATAKNGAKKFGGSAKEYFAEALKQAWKLKRQFEGLEKGMERVLEVKQWFMNKNFSSNEQFIAENSYQNDVVKETEKAVQIKFSSDYGKMVKWVPKSCLEA